MHLILIGFMGTGKSSVGRDLADRLGMPFADTDSRVEEDTGMTVADIFRDLGEETFRDKEGEVIHGLIEEAPKVVSCGGGAVLRAGNRVALRNSGEVFHLLASPEAILRRLEKDNTRPLLAGDGRLDKIRKMLEEREPYYRETADHSIDTDGREPGEVAAEIEEIWRRSR